MAQDQTILKPFLQDVIMARELTATLIAVMKNDPLFVPSILTTVGLPPLLDWLTHFLLLNLYTGITKLTQHHKLRQKVETMTHPRLRFILRRALERWEYGSGLDYHNDS